jgi:uncharacterized protein DUF3147
MIPKVDFAGLKGLHWRQFLVRFILGGAVTLCTGVVAERCGPVIGGLFLSFPVIFPASATLIERRENEKKQRAGVVSHARGRKAAALDAAGAVFGGWGLACFAGAAWLALANFSTALALVLAAIVWLVVSVSAWWLRRHAR